MRESLEAEHGLARFMGVRILAQTSAPENERGPCRSFVTLARRDHDTPGDRSAFARVEFSCAGEGSHSLGGVTIERAVSGNG